MSTLHDARLSFYVGSAAHVLAQDRAFIGDVFKSGLASGATFSIGLTTGNRVASIPNFSLSDRSDQTEIEIFEGGAYSGGTPLEFFNLNRSKNSTAIPFISSFQDVTIDTPGTRIRRVTVLGSTDKKNVTRDDSDASMLLAANTVYYIGIRNDDAAASDYDFQLSAAVGEYDAT